MTRLKSSLLKGLGERFHGRQGAAPLLRRSERELQGKDLRGSPYAAVKATIKRRPPSGGRVLLQAYRLQSGRSELSASA
jgi:hypothetical protein